LLSLGPVPQVPIRAREKELREKAKSLEFFSFLGGREQVEKKNPSSLSTQSIPNSSRSPSFGQSAVLGRADEPVELLIQYGYDRQVKPT
jgi:hypothetical protein